MDSAKLQKYMVPIALLFLSLGLIIFLFPKIKENITSYNEFRASIETLNAQVVEKTNTLNDLKKRMNDALERIKAVEKSAKPFYKPIDSGLDTEAVIAGEFAEVLELIRANKIKVRTIKYEYNPADDEFIKGAADKYNAARLKMEIISTYLDFDIFLKEMYKHKHFLDIESFEIVPYKKNRKILLINLKVKLYSQK